MEQVSCESQHPIESPNGLSSPDEAQIQLLLEEILETDMRPEQVSGGDLELERVLHERLNRVRNVQAKMEAMFPTNTERGDPTRRLLRESLHNHERVPAITGYEVYDVIGAGGMGVVYRARHLKLNRLVAIKMLLLGAYASRVDMECLLQEAQSVASLRHPNIVQVYDVAEHDGFPYYAMELLEGGDLANTLQGKPRAAREAAELVGVLASAVHAAHLAGIVHRDLKPGNILLSSDGTPKIGDFSLSRKVEHDSKILTNLRQAGTPSYMAPEQAAGKSNAIQPAVDIYSLGAVLYELLTGRPPFTADTSAETRRQVIDNEPVPPSRLNSRVPRDLQTICLKCLHKDPVRRYASAATLAEDIERFSSGMPILARPVGAMERAVKWCRRHPSTAFAIAVTVAALIAAVTGGIWLHKVQEDRRTDAIVRRESARVSIEAALPSVLELVKNKRWIEARGMLGTAQVHLADANSSELTDRLAAMEEALEVAQELDRIYQGFLAVDIAGYTYLPAREAYSRIFHRIGLGDDVRIEVAAGRAKESLLRGELLVALDLAACAENVDGDRAERDRLLAIGRATSPDPWQDRFRDPDVWQDVVQVRRLFEDAQLAEHSLRSHHVFLISHRLSKHKTTQGNESIIKGLFKAQLDNPSDPWVNYTLAEALRLDGDFEGALQFYRTTTVLQPENVVAWCALGWALKNTGDPEGAVAPLEKAIALRPDYPLGLQFLLDVLATGDRWENALARADEFTSANPEIELPAETKRQVQLYRHRSVRRAASKREWSVSAAIYSQMQEEEPPDAHNLFELAAVSLLGGDTAGYREVCASMLEQCESANLRRFLVARACTLAEVSDQELMQSTRIAMPELDQNANRYWSLTQRAALLCRQGNHREAIPFLEQSLRTTSQPEQNIISWLWLSRVKVGLGDHDAAKLWLGKATTYLGQSATKPESIHLHNWLEAHILRQEVETMLAR